MRGADAAARQVERFVRLPRRRRAARPIRFILLDDLVVLFLDRLFPGFRVTGHGLFRLIRDTDVEFEEEAEDLVRSYETALKRRRRGVVIHLASTPGCRRNCASWSIDELDAAPDEIHDDQRLLGLADLKQLIVDDRPDLLFPPYTPRFPERIRDFGGDCFAAIRAKDIIVHHPYESFDVVVQFLRQAAHDPSGDRDQADALPHQPRQPDRQGADRGGRGRQVGHRDGRAARPLRRGSQHPPGAHAWKPPACRWCIGFTGLKTHAKLSLVVRREAGAMRSYAHFGTGNYHPITARIYTDLSFFTCDPALTRDAARLFNYMTGYARPESMEELAFSPLTTRNVCWS